MSWRDKIAKALVAKKPLGPAEGGAAMALPNMPTWGERGWSAGYFDNPSLTLAPQAEAAQSLAVRNFNPQSAEQRLRQSLAGDAEWGAKVREREIPMVATEQMWRPANPAADTAWVGPRIQEYNDALRFMQNSQPIDRYGVR